MDSLNLELEEPRSSSSEPSRANTNADGFVLQPRAEHSLLHTLFLKEKGEDEGEKPTCRMNRQKENYGVTADGGRGLWSGDR